METCECCADIQFAESRKRGCELVDARKCDWCSEIFEKRSGNDAKQRKNQKSSDISTHVSVSACCAGVGANKTDESLASVGLIDPAKTGSREHHQKLKPRAMVLSELELKRIESIIVQKLDA